MVSGIALVLGLRTRVCDPCVYVVVHKAVTADPGGQSRVRM